MRPLASTAQHLIIHNSPPVSIAEPQLSSTTTPTCNSHTCRWRSNSNSHSNDFEANAAMILIILFCALICALALNAAIRCFLRGAAAGDQQQRRPSDNNVDLQQTNQIGKPSLELAAAASATKLLYTAGMKLSGAEAECAICLSDFVEGEPIQVLARCEHGFHVQCIQQWLSSHSSCPTCRSSATCFSPPPSQETTRDCIHGGPQMVAPEPHLQ